MIRKLKGIYYYVDKRTDEIVYIGRDSNIHKNQRHYDHLRVCMKDSQPFNRILQNNPDTYTYQVFCKSPHYSNTYLNLLEIGFIKIYNPKFNFTRGGEGNNGFKHSEESKQKMSDANKGENNYWYGKTLSEEHKKKISDAHKGKTHSEETKKKISDANKGKTHSEETKRKLSESRKGENNPMYGKHHSEEYKKKMSESRNTSGYLNVCKQKSKTCKQGFMWCYRYYENGKRKSIRNVDLKKLEKKVKGKGLIWRKL